MSNMTIVSFTVKKVIYSKVKLVLSQTDRQDKTYILTGVSFLDAIIDLRCYKLFHCTVGPMVGNDYRNCIRLYLNNFINTVREVKKSSNPQKSQLDLDLKVLILHFCIQVSEK